MLGGALIAAGLIVLTDVAVVALFSAKIVGVTAMAIGALEVGYGLFYRSGRGAMMKWLPGLFYVAFGAALLRYEEFRQVVLAYVLGFLLVVSGAVRIGLSGDARPGFRWLLVSGCVGVVAGPAILLVGAGAEARWVSFFLGVDLLIHGFAWLMIAAHRVETEPRVRSAPDR